MPSPTPPAVVPYGPPLPRPSSRSSRSSRRPPSISPPESVFDRLHSGLETAEHFAHEVEYVAGQVEKAGVVGERIVGDVEEAYGRTGGGGGLERAMGRERHGAGEMEQTETEAEEEVPLKQKKQPPSTKKKSSTSSRNPADYSPSPSPSPPADQGVRQRKPAPAPAGGDSLRDFEHDLDFVQETVDDLSDLVESIAIQRHRLTGAPYPRIAKLLRLGRQPHPLPRSREVETEEATQLAALVGQAREDLLEQYKRVRGIQGRYEPLAAALRGRPSSDKAAKKDYARVQKHLLALNSSFATLLDFVEDRAKDERKDVEGGESEARLLLRTKEEQPGWRREKRAAEAKNAREAAKKTSLDRISDITSYTAWWLIDNPFTSLDDVLQTIDHAENGIASKKDEKTGTWALAAGLVPQAFRSAKFSRSSNVRVKSMLEPGKTHSSSRRSAHNYHSEEKPFFAHSAGDALSSDEDDLSAEDKKLLAPLSSKRSKKSKGADDGSDDLDLSQLPERVPTDDTSGYQETKEELLEDARDQSRTEHLYTPLLVLWWAAIASLYLYWAIARSLGFPNPLGNVDLGSHLGNSAWNDTSDGLVRTSTASSFPLTSSTSASRWSHVEPTGPSTVAMSSVEAVASAMREVGSSVSAAGNFPFPTATSGATVPVSTASVTVV